MRHTGRGLECKKKRYIRDGDLLDKGLNIFPKREREKRNINKVNFV